MPPAPAIPPALEIDARRLGAILEAFEKDRVELHLQPVVSLPQRKPHFYEVLARLRLSDESILVPAEFLPNLERAGLVAELDRKVLTRAAAIARHLAAAVGLHGRDRRAASATERARVNVTRLIKRALDQITEHHLPLGAHLRAVRTGTFCSYAPPPDEAVAWDL